MTRKNTHESIRENESGESAHEAGTMIGLGLIAALGSLGLMVATITKTNTYVELRPVNNCGSYHSNQTSDVNDANESYKSIFEEDNK